MSTELLGNKFLAPTGRVKTFIENPDRGTLPASCTIFRLKGSSPSELYDMLFFTQKALITGAGVNLHLDKFDTSQWPKKVGHIVATPGESTASLDVQDSMIYDPKEEGFVSIVDASSVLLAMLLQGKKVYINLSNIRPEGTLSSKGQISSGPDSFLKVYQAVEIFAHNQDIASLLSLLSTFNEVIRRGGIYKNGAVTTSLPLWSSRLRDYLEAIPKDVHPWLKKGCVFPADWQEFPVETYLALEAVNSGQLWLEKAISAKDNQTWLTSAQAVNEPRLGHNVCREVLLDSEGTCILLPINLGQMSEPADLVKGFTEGMTQLCKFQQADHQSRAKIYLPASEDRQVGLGLIALANLLKLEGITYEQFRNELHRQLGYFKSKGVDGIKLKIQDYFAMGYHNPFSSTNVSQWVSGFISAYSESARIAESYGMKRAFAIAPTANVSYRYQDREGYTCAPEISPPVAKSLERLSETQEESTIFKYGNVETASEVGFMVYFDVANLFQMLMDFTGLGHAISFNLHEDMGVDFLEMWSSSYLKSTYYRLDVDQSYLDKTDQVKSACSIADKNCGSCG